jgi:histidyl-tRNA synthetase
LFYQLREANIIKSEESAVADVVVLPMTQDYEYVYKIVNDLRANKVKTDVCFMDKSFKHLIKYADKQNIEYSVIIGDNEVTNKTAVLKNMKTGEQKEVGQEDIVNCYFESKEKTKSKKLTLQND